MKLNELTAHELLDLLKEKKATPREIHDAVLARIQATDAQIKAYVRLRSNASRARIFQRFCDAYPHRH